MSNDPLSHYEQIPDYLQSTFDMLNCAFPEGADGDEYWALISLIRPGMTFRAVAHILGIFTRKGWARVYNDVLGLRSHPPPDAAVIEKVRRKLIACGYEDWLKSEL